MLDHSNACASMAGTEGRKAVTSSQFSIRWGQDIRSSLSRQSVSICAGKSDD